MVAGIAVLKHDRGISRIGRQRQATGARGPDGVRRGAIIEPQRFDGRVRAGDIDRPVRQHGRA